MGAKENKIKNPQNPVAPVGGPSVNFRKREEESRGGSENGQQDLKSSEDRYHKMIEEVEDYAILLLDREGIIQNWNKGAERIKGYKEAEVIGKSFRIFYLPEDRENKLPEQLMERAVTQGKALHEGWRLRKDGTRFWGSIVITTLHDDEGNIIGFSKVTRDLTDIKAATDQIKDYARELEFQNKELQQFTYAAAHDLKEPLRKVQFYLSAVMDSLAEKMPEKEKTYVNDSISSAARMSSLIDDLLRYSATSVVTNQFEPVALTAVMEDLKAFYQDSLEGGHINIAMDGPSTIWGVPFQIRQLFDNLIGNAVKYRQKDRPVHIDVSSRREYHQFGKEAEPNRVKAYFKVIVRDNGIGFDPEYAQKIFELFQRLHSRADYPGSGVGLAICKRIIQNHKGVIEADGNAGEGSAFTVHLPCP